MSDTINRNDLAALSIMKKIVDRMNTAKVEHDQRMAIYIAQVQQIQYAITQMNSMNNPNRNQLAAGQLSNAQQAAMYGHSTAYNKPTLASAMEYVPYLTTQEFAVLEAWANGEDVLLHLLSRE